MKMEKMLTTKNPFKEENCQKNGAPCVKEILENLKWHATQITLVIDGLAKLVRKPRIK